MKIGLVSQALPYLPSRGGFRLYGGNLIRHLSRRHEIHLVSMLIEDDEKHLDWARQYCASVTTIPEARFRRLLTVPSVMSGLLFGRPLHLRRAMAQALRPVWRSWDVIHVEGGYAGGIMPDLPIAKVLSVHDSWTLRCAEMVKCAQSTREFLYYKLLGYYEPRYGRLLQQRFERTTVVAEPDLRAIRRVSPDGRCDLIPYGTDTEYFHPVNVEKQPNTLVFHSHLGYAPNIEAALEFANDILPLVRAEVPDAVFHLVGAAPGPKIQELASRPGIRISANLPDLRSAVCTAQVYVCAIRHGTGLKSKMLEAMAMRLPIVGYPGAVVGLEGTAPGKHYLLAQDPKEFAAHVVSLLRDPRRAAQMAQAGRDLVEEKYSWESRARDYEELYEKVIKERKIRQFAERS